MNRFGKTLRHETLIQQFNLAVNVYSVNDNDFEEGTIHPFRI